MGRYALANRKPEDNKLYQYGVKAAEGVAPLDVNDDPLTGTQTPQTENNAVVDYARNIGHSSSNAGGGTPTEMAPLDLGDKKDMNNYLTRSGRQPVEDIPAVSEDDLKYWGDQYEAAMPRPTARTDEELRNDVAGYLGYTIPSKEDQEADRRRARIAVGMEGIGRGLANLANLYYTTQWAPSQNLGVSQTWKNWMAERKEQEAKNARYLAEFTRLQRENQRAIEDYEKRKGSYVASMMRRAIDAKNREETDNRRQSQKIELEDKKTEDKKAINEGNNATKVEVAKINTEGRKEVANINQAGADRRNAENNKVKESEGKKNRESRENIAKTNAEARKSGRSGSRSGGNNSNGQNNYEQYKRK